MKRWHILAALAAAIPLAAQAQQKLAYVDLVQRLTDLEHLATVPDAGEKTGQWSSYDRASRYDEATGKYIHWDANGDGGGFIRKEGNQFVFAEMEGPGCIFRIWSAAPKEGHVRIYLDGNPTPAVDLPFAEYFSGKEAPFTRRAIVHQLSEGRNNYTPIPYQKSCKIVADANWGAYYHFGFTTFPAGTEVPTFKRELGPEENAALDRADNILSHCGPREPGSGAPSGWAKGSVEANSAASSSLGGPRAINSIRVRFEPPLTPADRDVLRAATIQIRWDGESEASVWAPLGDFFGTAPGPNVYASLPCGYTADGWFYANWFMPFAKSAEIRFVNEGTDARKFTYEIAGTELRGDAGRYARFHAKWHRDRIPADRPGPAD